MNMKFFPAIVLVALALSSGSGLIAGTSSEEQLVETLALNDASPFREMNILYENKGKIQTEEANAEKASQVRMIRGDVVGKNRLLFEIRFDNPPVLDRSTFCLYLDTDNSPSTGRQDEGAEGVDLMVTMDAAGHKAPALQFRNPDLNAESTKMRAAWEGANLYITIETPLPETPSAMRVFFLSSKDAGASNFKTPAETLLEVAPSEKALPPLE